MHGRVTKGGLCSGEQLCFHVLGRQFLASGAGERNTIEINTTAHSSRPQQVIVVAPVRGHQESVTAAPGTVPPPITGFLPVIQVRNL